jgi:hypothetical protein
MLGYPPIDNPSSNLERMSTFAFLVRLGILFVKIDIDVRSMYSYISHCRKLGVLYNGIYVRKFMWQLCGWGRVDICMTFHMRAFDFFLT